MKLSSFQLEILKHQNMSYFNKCKMLAMFEQMIEHRFSNCGSCYHCVYFKMIVGQLINAYDNAEYFHIQRGKDIKDDKGEIDISLSTIMLPNLHEECVDESTNQRVRCRKRIKQVKVDLSVDDEVYEVEVTEQKPGKIRRLDNV